MQYIPILKQSDQVIDNNKRLIVGGKIEILEANTLNKIDVYTYDAGNEKYIIAENPIYLDVYSRPQQTYFVTQLCLCKLYRYIGDFSDPMIDNDDNNWRYIREWNDSWNYEESKNDTIVYGLNGLKKSNIELGSVSVVGYWNNYDCEMRTYVWDNACTQEPDNGYIVLSDKSTNGRWILSFEDEYIPSTYYGVYPGQEANINTLLNFVSEVGSADRFIKTAPGVYFKNGDYTNSTVGLVTEKKIMLDNKTSFTANTFTCPDVKVIGTPTKAICDFNFTAQHDAHSSWFRTARTFLNCGAKHLYIDAQDNFTDKVIPNYITITDKFIYGNSRLPLTYNDGAYLRLVNCVIVGQDLFKADDYIQYRNMEFTDEWYSATQASMDFGDITQGHKIDVRTLFNNTLDFANFKNKVNYAKAIQADGQTYLNMQNAEIQSMSLDTITEVVNLKSDTLVLNSVSNITLTNVNSQIRLPNMTENHLFYVTDCYLTFASIPTFGSIISNNSTIINEFGFDTAVTQVNFKGGVCNSHIGCSTASTYVKGKTLTLDNTSIVDNTQIKVNQIFMRNCECGGIINVYPYLDGDVYKASMYFKNNKFINEAVISLDAYGASDTQVNGVQIDMFKFIDNDFSQTDLKGIHIPFYAKGNLTKFTSGTGTSYGDNKVRYVGNTGNCPQETMTVRGDTSAFTQNVTDGSASYVVSTDTQRVFNWNAVNVDSLRITVVNRCSLAVQGTGPYAGDTDYEPKTFVPYMCHNAYLHFGDDSKNDLFDVSLGFSEDRFPGPSSLRYFSLTFTNFL